MTPTVLPRRQRGVATMFISMIMLILITLMVVTAYSLSTVNLRSVGNFQMREEAQSAAQKLIELTIDGEFWNPASPQSGPVDVGGVEYQVDMLAPVCLRATPANITTTSSVTLPGFSAVAAYNTVWLLDATAPNDEMGTRVRVRQGVRVLMNETDTDDFCGT